VEPQPGQTWFRTEKKLKTALKKRLYPTLLFVLTFCLTATQKDSRVLDLIFFIKCVIQNLATVITSLASAIPIVGDSIVTWLWGGFSVNIALTVSNNSAHILLDAGNT
jgi:hypothetical protein